MTGNKGEWSEIYTLFKLLGDKILVPGGPDLEKLTNSFYPILRILRTESNGDFIYSIHDNLIVITGDKKIVVPVSVFKAKAILLLKEIKSSTTRTFSIPEIETFMKEINCISLTASSSAKTDITIIVHDDRTNQQPILGFSIKSQLGNPSTLLNAGKTTNFIYEIEGNEQLTDKIDAINQIETRSKIKDRIAKIKEYGGRLVFCETEKGIFQNNLILIDSLLPQILSTILLEYYSNSKSRFLELVKVIEVLNPQKFDLSHNHLFYSYKLKRFLSDIALGMMPSKVWTGELDATGGYLVVRDDGEIICYHVYNRNEFESYLLNNTKLETPSSSRHKFGEVYKKKGKLFFKLNLQIRFLK
ncbi:MAG: HpaII family restriction endonuclease [Bacteroidota bacterium]